MNDTTLNLTPTHTIESGDPGFTVFILHTTGDSLLRPWNAGRTQLELAYSYTAYEEDLDLETIWRQNNAVDGDERNVVAHKRSLSVGDVVAIDYRDGEPLRCFAVDMIGWMRLPLGQTADALNRGKEVSL